MCLTATLATSRVMTLHEPTVDLMQQIDPDALTPKQALDVLYQLKELLAANLN